MKLALIVDDSPVIRKVASRLLENLSLQVLDAKDGRAGLSVCEQRMPDAILVDANMPEMDGFEFLGALRRMPKGRKPKVLFCTSEFEVGLIARALHAGADNFLVKPFDGKILRTKIAGLGLV
jgi:two-component system chemotaxis response regulator CheY